MATITGDLRRTATVEKRRVHHDGLWWAFAIAKAMRW